MGKIKYDVVGYWSEVKLDIVREYAAAYSRIIDKQRPIRKHIYIDAFAGPGQHVSKSTGEFIPGSPLNALLIQPPFSEYHLIDLNGDKAAELRRLVGPRSDVFIYTGEANETLLNKVLPRCRYEDFNRALCLLDPYAINVDWKVIERTGTMKSVEIFYNFMIMDANMNVLRLNPDRVDTTQSERMDRVWGDHSWREIAYPKVRGLFGDMEKKATNQMFAEAFRQRLSKVGGFEYVPAPMPMRNEQGAIVYYLYFASPSETGARIVSDIFKKYKERGIH